MRGNRPLALGGVLVSVLVFGFLFGFGVACVLFPLIMLCFPLLPLPPLGGNGTGNFPVAHVYYTAEWHYTAPCFSILEMTITSAMVFL